MCKKKKKKTYNTKQQITYAVCSLVTESLKGPRWCPLLSTWACLTVLSCICTRTSVPGPFWLAVWHQPSGLGFWSWWPTLPLPLRWSPSSWQLPRNSDLPAREQTTFPQSPEEAAITPLLWTAGTRKCFHVWIWIKEERSHSKVWRWRQSDNKKNHNV